MTKTNRIPATSALQILLAAAIVLSGVLRAGEAAPNEGVAAVLQPFVERKTVAGAVALVANKEKILTLEALGFADIAANKAMTTDATFWIASMTKPFTAAALMILVDEGKVKLDDPIEKFLPEFKGQMVTAEQDADHVLLKKPANPPTVRQILAHTSGMKFSSPIEVPTLDMLYLKDAVRSYAMMPLQWEPGSKYQYSNQGINAAGRIVEVVSGMPFEEFLQKRLLDPLGMKDTTFWPTDEQISRLAKTYKPNKEKNGLEETQTQYLKFPLNDKRRQPMPGGGLFSTAKDVSRFAQMLLNNGELDGKRYLSESSIKEMSRRQTAEHIKDSYGLGCSVGDGWFGHGGALATNMHIDTKRGLVVIYMVQHNGFPGDGGKAQGAFKAAAEEKFGAK
jgi:CubicO group peptidase (beta-lactamase class C family)